MKKLWAISEGSYSDYRILAVFGSKDDAELTLAGGYGDGIEELPYFPAGSRPQDVPFWRASARVSIPIEVAVKADVWTEGRWHVYWDNELKPPPKRPKVTERHLGRYSAPTGREVCAISIDRDAAIKAVKDRVASLVATEAGV